MTRFEIELIIEGPYLTQSSAVGGYGVDAPLARTGRKEKDKAYIPGSLLKGKLLQAWQEIGGLGEAGTLLGSESGNQQEPEKACDARTAKLHFDDLIQEGEAPKRLTHRIRIDRERGSVVEGALLVLESPFASGERITFKGQARLLTDSEAKPEDVKKWLEWGLRWTPSLGAERSTGFGRILGVKVSTAKPAGVSAITSEIRGNFQFSLQPQGPFCVAKQRLSGNLFESSSEIPGGTIKGMVAQMLLRQAGAPGHRVDAALGAKLGRYQALCSEFERVRFTHAFPARIKTNKRPVRAPLSLVMAGKQLYDAADRDKPFLVGGEAPQFDIDWKKDPDGLKQFGWDHRPKTELRVRTAIDPEKLRADDEKLFAYEMVNPEEFEWLGSVDVSQVSERARVANELAVLMESGLSGLGKTKTEVKVRCKERLFVPRVESSATAAAKGEWRVTLMTSALLNDPARLTESTGNHEELLEAYRETWTDLSCGAVKLERFFARQTLAGGHYLYKRFQRGDCLPWLLTNAGSVFVLKAVNDNAGEFVQAALDGGLNLPGWAKKRYGATWETCPFVRENGYGEVAVNLAIKNVALPEEGVTDVDEAV